MALLKQKVYIVGERRKSGKTAAEARNQKHIHRGRDDITPLGEAKEYANKQATDDIHHKSTPREGCNGDGVAHLTNQKTQASAHKAAHTGQKHSFYHIFSSLI
jgi:hypothetical protein